MEKIIILFLKKLNDFFFFLKFFVVFCRNGKGTTTMVVLGDELAIIIA
jgi:hypothetical protein